MADIKLSDIFGGVGGMSDQVIVNKNDITTLKSDVATKVNKAGDTMTGQLNLNGNKSVTFGNTNNYINISGNLLYLAANNSAGYVTIEGAANPKVKVGANIYDLYHGGNKQQELPVRDVRGAARAPNYFAQKSVTSWFNEIGNPSTAWYSGINVCGWQSADYAAWQLASYASSGNSDNRLWFRTGRAATWNSWCRVYHEGDKPQPSDIGAYTKDEVNHSFVGGRGSKTAHIKASTINGYIPSGYYTVGIDSTTNLPPGVTGQVALLNHTSFEAEGNTGGFDLLTVDSMSSPLWFRPGTGAGKGGWQKTFTSAHPPSATDVGLKMLRATTGTAATNSVLDVTGFGTGGTWTGINFPDAGHGIITRSTGACGLIKSDNSAWRWLWEGDTLSIGKIPWARIPDAPATATRWPTAAEAGAIAMNTTAGTPVGTYYRTTGQNASVGTKIRLPVTFGSGAMPIFTVRIYQGYKAYDIQFSGYLYSTPNNWHSPVARMIAGEGPIEVSMGRDTDGRAYVWIAGGDYRGVAVFNLVAGYQAVNWNTGWEILESNDRPNAVYTTTCYPPFSKNNLPSAADIAQGGSLTVATGQNIQWGGSYSTGYPTIAATGSAATGSLFFYPTGNHAGESLSLTKSLAAFKTSVEVRGALMLKSSSTNDAGDISWFNKDGVEVGRLWLADNGGNEGSLVWRKSGSGTTRKIYHEGNPPSAAAVGALPIGGGTITGNLTVNGDISGHEVYARSWLRTTGAKGWFNETYAGGIYMRNAVWVEIYNNKKFYVENKSYDSIQVGGGIQLCDGNVAQIGCGLTGAYAADKFQGVFAMGHQYRLPENGVGTSNHYGIAWTHSNNPSEHGKRVSGHHMCVVAAGKTKVALGDGGIWVEQSITAGQNITAYSDKRVKANIKNIPDAINKVMQLNGVTYTRIDQEDKEKLHTGVIAQEVEAVLPEAVITTENGDIKDFKSVAYGNLVGLLIEAIKEQQSSIKDLKQEIDELKAR